MTAKRQTDLVQTIYNLYDEETGQLSMLASGRFMFVWNAERNRFEELRFDIVIYEGLKGHWHCDIINIPLKIPVFFEVESAIWFIQERWCPLAANHFNRISGVRTVPSS